MIKGALIVYIYLIFSITLKAQTVIPNDQNVREPELNTNKVTTRVVKTQMIQPSITSVQRNFYYASAVQCKDSYLKSWNCKSCAQIPGTKFIRSFSNFLLNTRGYVALDLKDKAIVLSFRGTDGLINGLSDLFVVQGKFKAISDNTEARVHNGFLGAMESLSKDFLDTIGGLLNQTEYSNYNIKVVGHSMGGAMASLAVIKLQNVLKLNWSKLQLFTYGQPRTGNWQFAQWYDSKPLTVARTVNYDDVVTRMPPNQVFNYSHHGNELFLDQSRLYKGTRYCSKTVMEDPACGQSVPLNVLNTDSHTIYFNVKIGKVESC